MILPLQKFSILMENMAAAVQGGSQQLIDLSVGSVLRALMEASAACAMWMQWLIIQVLSMTRAATSTGPDLDSWMADFSLSRLPGAASIGLVNFSRYTAGIATTIPVGTVVYTSDRSQSFVVIADASNPGWNGDGGYSLSALTTTIAVPVQCALPGAAGNILAGAIGWLLTAIPGVDVVSNQAPFAGGADAEGDTAFRARFQLYINSRSLSTVSAVEYAIATVSQGLRYVVLENVDSSEKPSSGHFVAIVDDGSGSLPASLLASVGLAIEMVRPIGSTYSVVTPTVLSAAVQLNIVTSDPSTRVAVCLAIETAIAAWIASLPIGGTLAISKLEALAHNSDTTVISVARALINGVSADLSATEAGVIIASTIVVS